MLRVNDSPDGFRDDEFATRYRSSELPVPEVFAIGEAFGRWFAISRRHRGRFLEDIGADEAGMLGPTVVKLLAGLRAVDRRIRSLLEACPDRRELVHSDLLHHNVLVTPSADAISAVFSWKCSTWGDSVYDLAWCTFRGRWHEGIGALGLWERVVPTLSASEAVDVAVRHHVYELQIGASHLGWYATLGDTENLQWTSRQPNALLERGPL